MIMSAIRGMCLLGQKTKMAECKTDKAPFSWAVVTDENTTAHAIVDSYQT